MNERTNKPKKDGRDVIGKNLYEQLEETEFFRMVKFCTNVWVLFLTHSAI